jgi:hypothetical protein
LAAEREENENISQHTFEKAGPVFMFEASPYKPGLGNALGHYFGLKFALLWRTHFILFFGSIFQVNRLQPVD